ncbi:endonuclease V [Candidatus Woesearchaeota archaeon]|nr:MAG: endonuclease V [Candidatus Woesearchaeota archaeon]
MDLKKLKKEQLELSKKVLIKDEIKKISTIAGCDQAFFDHKIVSAIVVMDYESMKPIESKYAILDVAMPYIPGFLSYREAPAIVEAFSRLSKKPDVLLVDGNGILHPRRIGIASHIGLLLDVPTIGIAKKLLIGDVEDDNVIVDKEIRAKVLSTKKGSKPIYVSPGHKVSMRTSIQIVKHALNETFKLPLPLHEAHKLANKIRKRKRSDSEA